MREVRANQLSQFDETTKLNARRKVMAGIIGAYMRGESTLIVGGMSAPVAIFLKTRFENLGYTVTRVGRELRISW